MKSQAAAPGFGGAGTRSGEIRNVDAPIGQSRGCMPDEVILGDADLDPELVMEVFAQFGLPSISHR